MLFSIIINDLYFKFIKFFLYKRKTMELFNIQAAQTNYLNNENKNLQYIISVLKAVLHFDQHILSFFPKLRSPPTEAFWITLSKKPKTRTQRLEHLMRVSSAYFQIEDSPFIDLEYDKLLLRNRSIPSIISLLYDIHNIKKGPLDDFIELIKRLQKIHQKLQKNREQKFYPLLLWRIESCLIILNRCLKKKDFEKNRFLEYVRHGRNLRLNNQCNPETLLGVYKFILSERLQQKYYEKNNAYLEMQLQILVKNFKFILSKKTVRKVEEYFHIKSKEKLKEYLKDYQQENNLTENVELTEEREEKKFKFMKKLAFFTSKSLSKQKSKRQFKLKNKNSSNQFDNVLTKKEVKSPAESKRLRSGIRVTRYSQKKKLFKMTLSKISLHQCVSSAFEKENNLYKMISDHKQKQSALQDNELLQELVILPNFEQLAFLPTFEQILIQKQTKVKVDSSFVSMGLLLTNFSIHNVQLTIIHYFGDQIVFLKHLLKVQSSHFTTVITCLQKNILNEKIFFAEDEEDILFEDFQRLVTTSQLYFELIQEKTQKTIERSDIQSLSKLVESCNPKTAHCFLEIDRSVKSYLYWYFTQVNKINGKVMKKRKISHISDTLKFSIALDFLRKYHCRVCLQKMRNVRNKTGLSECFKYLAFGRKILLKGFLKKQESRYFYTLTIDEKTYNRFKIKEKKSFFQNPVLFLNYYENWNLKQTETCLSPLTSEQMTLIFLGNIIQCKVQDKLLRKLIMAIQKDDVQTFSFSQKRNEEFSLVADEDEAMKQNKFYQISRKQITNFIPFLCLITSSYQINRNFKVKGKTQTMTCINKLKYYITDIYLKNGILLSILQHCKKKSQLFLIIHFSHKFISKQQYYLIQNPYVNRISPYLVAEENDVYQVCLTKKNLLQQYVISDYRSIWKGVIKQNKKYLYVCLGWQKSIRYWRIDVYEGVSCRRFMTYFGAQNLSKLAESEILYYFSLNGEEEEKNIWREHMKKIKISLDFSSIKIEKNNLSLFETFARLDGYDEKVKGILQLVQVNEELCYFLVKVKEGRLEMGEADENSYSNNINIFADRCSRDMMLNNRNDLFVRLYLRFIHSNLPSCEVSICDIHKKN